MYGSGLEALLFILTLILTDPLACTGKQIFAVRYKFWIRIIFSLLKIRIRSFYVDGSSLERNNCFCCLPYNRSSNWECVVEAILAYGNWLRSTHCISGAAWWAALALYPGKLLQLISFAGYPVIQGLKSDLSQTGSVCDSYEKKLIQFLENSDPRNLILS